MNKNGTSYFFRLGLIAAMGISLAACIGDEAPSSSLADAQQAFDDNEFREARSHLVNLVRQGDADEQAYLLQMKLSLELGDGVGARVALEKLSDETIDARSRRSAEAHAYILEGRADRAIELFEDVPIETFTEDDFHMALWALRELREGDDFSAGMEIALAKHPNSTAINTLAGNELLEMGIADVAEDFAERAIAEDPKDIEALMLSGRVHIFKGDLKSALGAYQKAHSLYPDSAVPVANIAGLQLDLKKFDEAEKTLEGGLERHPEFPQLLWQKARHSYEIGRFNEAREVIELVRLNYRDNPSFILLSAKIEEALGNTSFAAFEYHRYLDEAGSDPAIEAHVKKLEDARRGG